jgi:hypothetical protein
MSLVDAQAGLTGLLPCNEGCGGNYERYSFTQNDVELVVSIPIPEGTKSKQIHVAIGTSSLTAGLTVQPPVLSGTLFKPIRASESLWSIEEKKFLVITLAKANIQFEEWWPHITLNETQIDLKTLKPPSKHIREFDSATQATVAKMMFDQEQKRKGLPTSDEELMMQKGFMPPQFSA